MLRHTTYEICMNSIPVARGKVLSDTENLASLTIQSLLQRVKNNHPKYEEVEEIQSPLHGVKHIQRKNKPYGPPIQSLLCRVKSKMKTVKENYQQFNPHYIGQIIHLCPHLSH